MIAAVRKESHFYLVQRGESDPWAYAQYHCGTSANIYSNVHWSFMPGWADPAPEVFYETVRAAAL